MSVTYAAFRSCRDNVLRVNRNQIGCKAQTADEKTELDPSPSHNYSTLPMVSTTLLTAIRVLPAIQGCSVWNVGNFKFTRFDRLPLN